MVCTRGWAMDVAICRVADHSRKAIPTDRRRVEAILHHPTNSFNLEIRRQIGMSTPQPVSWQPTSSGVSCETRAVAPRDRQWRTSPHERDVQRTNAEPTNAGEL